MKEKDIQKQILDWLRWHKVFCWKSNTAGIYRKSTDSYIPAGMRGISDIIGIFNGRMICIEVKMPKKKPSEFQQRFIDSINKSGGIAFVAHSLDEVETNLKDIL